MQAATILTVSQFTRKIKLLLEQEGRFVRLCGEVSNLRTPASGHSYFTLKDESAQIRIVWFKQQKGWSVHQLQDGQQVLIFGRLSVYEARGEYQIIADTVEMYGRGKLQLQFEQLKSQLQQEGYFAREVKKELPGLIQRVAVITSPTSAAIRDFLAIVKARKAAAHIQILPVKVQGDGAAGEIAAAIRLAERATDAQVIVLCRGGGSIEDLWAFNERIVADAIFHCSLPVITGIGHEIDFTIADFCADLRCPTPTAAAESLFLDQLLLRQRALDLQQLLTKLMAAQLTQKQQKLREHQRGLAEIRNYLHDGRYRLAMGINYAELAIMQTISNRASRVSHLEQRLAAQSPTLQIDHFTVRTQNLQGRMEKAIASRIYRCSADLARQAGLLQALSPLAILSRGYSIARKTSNEGKLQVIVDHNQCQTGDTVGVLLASGELLCQVLESRPSGDK